MKSTERHQKEDGTAVRGAKLLLFAMLVFALAGSAQASRLFTSDFGKFGFQGGLV